MYGEADWAAFIAARLFQWLAASKATQFFQ
jgi:hypothetical protein